MRRPHKINATRPTAQALEARLLLTAYTVTSAADAGAGTFRQAILNANATPGKDTISFQLAGGNGTVNLLGALPDVTDPVTVDGGPVLIRPAAALGAVNFDGLVLASSGSTISGVFAGGFRHGFVIRGSNNSLDGVASSALVNGLTPNTGDGVRVESGTGNEIAGPLGLQNGGLAINLGADGVTPNDPLDADTGPNDLQNSPVLTQVTIDNNRALHYVGTLSAVPNTSYLLRVYGGVLNPAGNLQPGTAVTNDIVRTDAGGNAPFDLVSQYITPGTYVAMTATQSIAGARSTSELSAPVVVPRLPVVVTNVNATGAGSLSVAIANANMNPGPDTVSFAIPGNGVHRISIDPRVSSIQEGYTGLTIDATTQPGYAGSPVVEIVASGTRLNGSRALSFNSGSAIVVRGLAIGGFDVGVVMGPDGVLENSYIGLAADGTPIPNTTGVAGALGATIGGTVAAARNVISANTYGIRALAAITVQGNYIGTDPTGQLARPNSLAIALSGDGTLIGGTTAAARNVISGNSARGVATSYSSGSTYVNAPIRLYGNYIGVAADGVTPLGNGGDAVYISDEPVTVGGVLPGQANVIAYNAGSGVVLKPDTAKVGAAQRDAIRGNSIYANAKLGIDLGDDGVTLNDALDADAGANFGQNFPTVAAASGDGASTLVSGSFDGKASATFTLDFYASPTAGPSGYGQGKTYLGSATVTTDAAGHAAYAANLPVAAPPGHVVAATATAADNSTSEFSPAAFVAQPGDANRDRAVNFTDLTALAQNYNTFGGRTLAQGDFTGDGNVDFNDLVKLAQNYNTTLPGAAPITAAAASMSFEAAFALATQPPAAPARKPAPAPARKPEPVFSTKPPVKAPTRTPAKPARRA